MKKNAIPGSGLRMLTSDEMQLVSGGYSTMQTLSTIIVTGGSYSMWHNAQAYHNYYFNDGDDYYGSDGDQGGGDSGEPDFGNGMTSEEAERAINVLNGVRAALEDALNRYGPGTMLDLDGKLLPISEVLQHVERGLFLLEAGTLVWGLENGSKDVASVLGWVFGIAAAGVAAEASAPIVVTAAIGYVASQVGEGVLRSLVRVVDGVEERIDIYIEEFVATHSVPGDYSNNPYDFFRGLLGIPNPWRMQHPQ